MDKKEFTTPNGKQAFYSFVKIFTRKILKQPKIINLAGELINPAIILANHSAKSGPAALDLYYPIPCCKWGAHEMFGNYNSRKSYLRDILYIKKCSYKKGFKTSFKASILAIFSKMIYKGMRMMPTYPDARLTTTIKNSMTVLEDGVSIMIFPENSNNGYKTVLTEFFAGFVLLSQRYYKKHNVDLPIYPVYISIDKNILVIGKPIYMQELVNKGLTRDDICKTYCDAVNQLYYDYVKDAQVYNYKKDK